MPKRSRRTTDSPDVNLLASRIVREATGQTHDEPAKNPHAVALGRLGGLRGGRARAVKLSAKRKREIARKAARARWKRRQG